jgi:hypothetical protein
MQTLFDRREPRADRVRAWIAAHWIASALAALLFVAALVGWVGYTQLARIQEADPTFVARVDAPAYSSGGPTVLFDAAHWNLHTPEGFYRPFADLLRRDGYRIEENRGRFDPERLRPYRLVAIVNAFGWRGLAAQLLQVLRIRRVVQWDLPAFTAQECTALRDWVRDGGGLLLIADHAPAGSAARDLAREFGVVMTNWGVDDEQHSDPDSYSWLVFSRENGLLRSHPITEGRGPSEQVRTVVSFTGQGLVAPPGSVPFLALADSAREYPFVSSTYAEGRSAAGHAQGVALQFWRGRVVVLGEAAMLSAQMFRARGQEIHLGMGYPGSDNRLLALNIMHWLSGILP